jgi:hypothetical protein
MRLRLLGAIVAVLGVLLFSSVVLASFPEQSVGQGSSDIWVMNLDETQDAAVVASYVNQSGAPDSSVGATISPLGNASFPASSSGLSDDWLGSMVLYSDREVASVAELHWQNVPLGDGWSGGAYVGYSEGANEVFFPGLVKTPSHESIATIQCVDTVDCNVWMTYRDVGGNVEGASPYTEVIEADSQESYDLHDPSLNPNIPTGLAASWTGSLQVTSTQKIAAVMTVHWVYGYAAAYNGIVPGDDTEIFFPAVNRRNFGGWLGQSDWQGLTVQNLNDSEIDVWLSFYALGESDPKLAFSDTIPAYSSHGYNTRYNEALYGFDALGDAFLGTARVTSTMPIAGISGLVRAASGGLAGGYQAVPIGSDRLVFPVAYRVKSGSTWLNETALAVSNLDSTSDVTVTLKFMNPNGMVGAQFDDTIPAASVHAYNTRYGGNTPSGAATFEPLGDSWKGTVVVAAADPSGEILGVVTNQTGGSGYTYLTSANMIPH